MSKKERKKQEYFEQAFTWSEEKAFAKERVINCYQKVTVGLLALSASLGIGMAVMSTKQTTVPFLAVMDKRTGEITTPSKITSNIEMNNAMLRHLVVSYVKAREGYNFININTPYKTVISMSAPKIGKVYQDYMQPKSNKESPIEVYGKRYYRKTFVQSVNQLPENHLLDVRFSTALYQADNDKEVKHKDYRATIKWALTDKKRSLKAVELNPMGFVVTHYDKQPISR